MIQLNNVTKSYHTERIETLALDAVTLSIADGEFVAIMGPSGCGKTTLLNLMGLLDTPDAGELLLDDQSIGGQSDRKLSRLRNRKIGFVFQSFHLVQDLNVVDNVEVPLLYRPGVSGRERRRLAREALDQVGLSSRIFHFPNQLSGGQQQRVAVARAIVGAPQILLADEPTGNLDSRMGDEIMDLLKQRHDAGSTVVMVTHDQRMADCADRTVRLFDGRQVQ